MGRGQWAESFETAVMSTAIASLGRVLDPLERRLDVDRAHRGEEEADRPDVRRAVRERRRVDVAGGVGGGIGVEDPGHHVERGGGVEREQQRLHRREEDETLLLERSCRSWRHQFDDSDTRKVTGFFWRLARCSSFWTPRFSIASRSRSSRRRRAAARPAAARVAEELRRGDLLHVARDVLLDDLALEAHRHRQHLLQPVAVGAGRRLPRRQHTRRAAAVGGGARSRLDRASGAGRERVEGDQVLADRVGASLGGAAERGGDRPAALMPRAAAAAG